MVSHRLLIPYRREICVPPAGDDVFEGVDYWLTPEEAMVKFNEYILVTACVYCQGIAQNDVKTWFKFKKHCQCKKRSKSSDRPRGVWFSWHNAYDMSAIDVLFDHDSKIAVSVSDFVRRRRMSLVQAIEFGLPLQELVGRGCVWRGGDKEVSESGFTCRYFWKRLQYRVKALRQQGWSVSDMRDAGVPALDIIAECGQTIGRQDFKSAFSVTELLEAGVPIAAILEAKYPQGALRSAGVHEARLVPYVAYGLSFYAHAIYHKSEFTAVWWLSILDGRIVICTDKCGRT